MTSSSPICLSLVCKRGQTMVQKFVYVLVLALSCVYAKHELYDGYSLFDVTVKDVEQTQVVNEIENQLGLDVWSHALPNRAGQVLVAPEQKQAFEEALTNAGVDFKVNINNIKEALDLEDEMLSAATRNGSRASAFPFDSIHRYEVINNYIRDIARRYPNIVTMATAGRSVQGREINYLKISSSNFQDQNKPVVIIESLLHCREWVGLSVSLYAIQKLVVEAADPEYLRNIDWIIVPIANPDGFEWTHTNARFWRKNRRTGFMVGDFCLGVDLNRNFDMNFGTASSNSVCSDTFHGSGPFSEPETQAIRNLILEHRNRLELFLDIHSFGSMILYGFGNGVLPPNGLFVHLNGVLMAQTIDRFKWPNKPNYIVGNVAAILYQASGSAQDYAQANGATYSYTYELPAFNNLGSVLQGFLVDPAFIEQAGFETWQGIKAGARYAADNFYRRKGIDISF